MKLNHWVVVMDQAGRTIGQIGPVSSLDEARSMAGHSNDALQYGDVRYKGTRVGGYEVVSEEDKGGPKRNVS